MGEVIQKVVESNGNFPRWHFDFFSALKNHLEKYKEESKEQHISLEKTIIFQKVSRAQTQHFVAIRSTGSRSWPKKTLHKSAQQRINVNGGFIVFLIGIPFYKSIIDLVETCINLWE